MSTPPTGELRDLELEDSGPTPQVPALPPTGELEVPCEDVPSTEGDSSALVGNTLADSGGQLSSTVLTKCFTVLGTIGLAVFGITYLAYRVLDLYIAYRQTHQLLAVAYLIACALIAIVLLFFAGRAWRRYAKLKTMDLFQELTTQVQRDKGSDTQQKRLLGMIRSFVEYHCHAGSIEAMNRAKSLRATLNTYEDASGAVKHLEEYVLNTMDKQADRMVLQRATQAALGTALASGRIDGFIVLWQSLALVDDVSTLYAGRPGFLGTVRLLRRALAMTVLAEIAEQATELLADAVASRAVAKLSGRAVQGFGNGLLMLRLGNAVKRQCRPIAKAGGRVPATDLVGEIARTLKNGKKCKSA